MNSVQSCYLMVGIPCHALFADLTSNPTSVSFHLLRLASILFHGLGLTIKPTQLKASSCLWPDLTWISPKLVLQISDRPLTVSEDHVARTAASRAFGKRHRLLVRSPGQRTSTVKLKVGRSVPVHAEEIFHNHPSRTLGNSRCRLLEIPNTSGFKPLGKEFMDRTSLASR